jgi:hypothetical protein
MNPGVPGFSVWQLFLFVALPLLCAHRNLRKSCPHDNAYDMYSYMCDRKRPGRASKTGLGEIHIIPEQRLTDLLDPQASL